MYRSHRVQGRVEEAEVGGQPDGKPDRQAHGLQENSHAQVKENASRIKISSRQLRGTA